MPKDWEKPAGARPKPPVCQPHHGRWFQTSTLDDILKTEAELKRNPL